ncbi:hypothetical protein RchiOBHm_Chr2g0113411 [Rosa chinensis]|uniref:Uncharacterized protein n=1 Tax=Rosa chinensis TaxID=74649 RepID=A0A2P6RQF7_ROSCH|nr:hypothetical protein RchiOBHm_Chr2g0113411 [Rosa chinensis]
MFQTVNKKLLSPWREKNLDATVLCPCLPTLPANSLAAHPEEVDEEKVVVMEKKISSESSSSTGSDGSNKRVFPVLDPEIVLLDKSQHDHAEVMKEHDDSTSSNIEKKEGVKYKKSKSTGTLLRRWSFKGLLRRNSNERAMLVAAPRIRKKGRKALSYSRDASHYRQDPPPKSPPPWRRERNFDRMAVYYTCVHVSHHHLLILYSVQWKLIKKNKW